MSKELSFEQALQRLDEIVSKLNSANIPLEEALNLYAESATLIAYCSNKLNEAKLQIEEVYPLTEYDEEINE